MVAAFYARLDVIESKVVVGENGIAIDAAVVIAEEYLFASRGLGHLQTFGQFQELHEDAMRQAPDHVLSILQGRKRP